MRCIGAKVLPRSTFGAVVSEYFSNLNLACGFDVHSAMTWRIGRNATDLLGSGSMPMGATEEWRAYCQRESTECGGAHRHASFFFHSGSPLLTKVVL
jgi:hypothetical protein